VERSDRRQIYNGFSEALARAFELALTPAVFAGFGYLLDRWLDLVPVLTIVFFAVGVVGVFVKLWLGYDAEMRAQEAQRPQPRPTTSDTDTDPDADPRWE
jgi:hypothetical protein